MRENEGCEETVHLAFAEFAEFAREAARRSGQVEERDPAPPFYRIALGLVPIELGEVEFRILQLLASKPYRPFTRERIAQSVTTDRRPVSESDVDGLIVSLREQLGFFRDYVQTVPYMGYRFKA
jgi:DNA-binding response OmpR family regulator